MNKHSFQQFQALINDFVGFIVVLWSMTLISIHGAGWEFVALACAGMTAIVGKKIGTLMVGNGMGGGTDYAPDVPYVQEKTDERSKTIQRSNREILDTP